MKQYRFFTTLIATFTFCAIINAQKEIPDSTEVLFDSNGSFTRVINTPEEVDAKLITVNPLIDEVVWRKVVTRAVDLREQVNRPLYYPDASEGNEMDETTQKNLFAIILYNLYKENLDVYVDPNLGGPDAPQFKEEFKRKYEDFDFFRNEVMLEFTGEDIYKIIIL